MTHTPKQLHTILFKTAMCRRMPPWFWNISENGKNFIKSYEGFGLQLYNDPDDNATIGWGHLVDYFPVGDDPEDELPFKYGITIDRAIDLFNGDLGDSQSKVQSYIYAPLYQYEYDALVSLAFNAPKSFKNSLLRTLINQGDYSDARSQFQHVGQQLPGLITRRIHESWIFAYDSYVDNP